LQGQDAHIVHKANDIFKPHKTEMKAMSKRISNDASHLEAVIGTNIGIQRSLKDINSKIQKFKEVVRAHTPPSGCVPVLMVFGWIQLQTWMRVTVYVQV